MPFLRNFRSIAVLQCPLLTVPSSSLSLRHSQTHSEQSHAQILLLLKKLVWQRPSSLFGPCRTWPLSCEGCMRVCELEVAWVSPHHCLRRDSLPAPDLPGGLKGLVQDAAPASLYKVAMKTDPWCSSSPACREAEALSHCEPPTTTL